MDLTPETEYRLRKAFRWLNKFMLALWRLGLASYGNPSRIGGAIMVIKHKGRKSGITRYAPVNFLETDEFVYCTAGFGEHTHWYRNLQANPEVELWLPGIRWACRAEDVSQVENRVAMLRGVLFASGFAGPLFGVNPHRMSEEQVENLLDYYRLIRFSKLRPATGPGGPGDLAWVWPSATLLLIWLLVRRRNRVGSVRIV